MEDKQMEMNDLKKQLREEVIMEQNLKLQKWIDANKEDWYKICGINHQEASKEDYERLSVELTENGFKDIFLVLLYRYSKVYGFPTKR